LSQDVLNQPGTTGQQWDTYGETVSTITAPNYWDVSQKTIQNSNIINVRMHDASNDSALMGTFRVVVGYAKVLGGDRYASQLIKLNWGDDFCALDIENISQYAAKTQTFPFGYHATLQPVMFYVFVDGESIKGGSVVLKSGSTTITTVTLAAGDSYGKMYSYDASAKAPASAYTITFTGIAGETSRGNIHAVMVGNYQLPAGE
jgi:hypothetical protein